MIQLHTKQQLVQLEHLATTVLASNLTLDDEHSELLNILHELRETLLDTEEIWREGL